MAFREETVSIWTCDNCRKDVVEPNDKLGVPGIFGEVVEYDNKDRKVETNFFACQDRCVGKAVRTALDMAWVKLNNA